MRLTPIYRRLSQIVFFGITGTWLLIGSLRCPFGVPFVSCTSCPLDECPGRKLQPWIIGLIGLLAVFTGRAFCGWLCPFGLIQDMLAKFPKPKWAKDGRMATADRLMKWIKYFALAMLPIAVIALNMRTTRPWEYVTRAPSPLNMETVRIAWSIGGISYIVGIVIFAAAIIGGLIIPRFWCRYLCPLGALLGLFNKTAILQMRKNQALCSECGKYPEHCPQYTQPSTLDCTLCGECIQECPHHAVQLKHHTRKTPNSLSQSKSEKTR